MTKKQLFYRFISMVFFIVSLPAQEPQIFFRAQPESVQFGDPVVLSWKVPEKGTVYLTNIGIVSSEGQIEITPEKKTTVYTLLFEETSGITTAHVTIKMTGGKGEVFPQQEEFKHARTYKIAAPSFTKLLDIFHAVLQDSSGLEVDDRYKLGKAKMVFVTKTSMRPDLAENENRIRFRRLAFLVEVSENRSQEGKYTCVIRTLIEYQRRKERKWRLEKSDDIHRQSAEKLCDSIVAAL